MSISIQVNNRKVVQLKLAETFGDFFDTSVFFGKFSDVDFIYDGNILQVQKNTKLSQYFAGKDQVSIQIVRKIGQSIWIPPQPPKPPGPLVLQNPPILPNPPIFPNHQVVRKKITHVPNVDNLQEFKQVDQFTVKICERGNRVELENTTIDFKAIFLEEMQNLSNL